MRIKIPKDHKIKIGDMVYVLDEPYPVKIHTIVGDRYYFSVNNFITWQVGIEDLEIDLIDAMKDGQS